MPLTPPRMLLDIRGQSASLDRVLEQQCGVGHLALLEAAALLRSAKKVVIVGMGASLNAATSGGAKEVATWGPHLFEVVVCGFLAPYTEYCPRHRGKPLRVDVFIALLAGPKVAFLDSTESRTGVSKLVEFPVQVTNRECAL